YDITGALASTLGAARTVWVNGTSSSEVSPTVTFGRNTFGEVTDERDATGGVTTTAYDTSGRPTTVTSPGYTPFGGATITAATTTSYNSQGLPASITDALGNQTTLEYNKYGWLTRKTEPDPDGSGAKAAPVWQYGYSRSGDLLDTTDPTGAHALATFDEL